MSLDKHQTETLKFIANVFSVKFLSGLNLMKANNELFDAFELIWFASSTENGSSLFRALMRFLVKLKSTSTIKVES